MSEDEVLFDPEYNPEWYERMILWFYHNIWEKRDVRRRLRWFWQRRTRGFDDLELWNLHYSFTDFILPRLKAFRELGLMGCPVLEGYEFNGNHDGMHDEWKEILDKMVNAFYYMKIDMEDMHYPPSKMMKKEDGTIYFKHYPGYNYDEYTTEMKRRWDVIEEGLKLFGKYYQGIWD